MNKKCRHFRKIYPLVRRNDCHDPINSFGNFVPASRSTAQPAARLRDTHNSSNIYRKFVTRTLKIVRNLGSRAALLSSNTQRRHTDRQNNSFTGKWNSVFTDLNISRVAILVDRGHGRSFPGAAAIRQAGKLYALALEVLRCIPRRPFQFREFVQQFWFIASVSILPTALVAIPFGGVIALHVGSLTTQIGAQSFTGAASVLAIIQQASPIVTALLIAGAGGSAMCADLGSRTIREEIDALKVLGVSPIQRFV